MEVPHGMRVRREQWGGQGGAVAAAEAVCATRPEAERLVTPESLLGDGVRPETERWPPPSCASGIQPPRSPGRPGPDHGR